MNGQLAIIKCLTNAQGYALINGRYYRHPDWPSYTEVWVCVLSDGSLFDPAIQLVAMEPAL